MREYYNKLNIDSKIFHDHKFYKGGATIDKVFTRISWYIYCMTILRTNLTVLGWAYNSDKTIMSPADCVRGLNDLKKEDFEGNLKDLIDTCGALIIDKNGAWGVGEDKFMKWQDSVKRSLYQQSYRESHNKEKSPIRK